MSARRRAGPRGDSDAPQGAATGIALGFIIGGWALYALLAPIAVFLTWWDDCADVTCQVPTGVEQAAYAVDLVWWLAFPFAAWFAYRGRQWAWAGLLVIAVILDVQVVAAIAGVRGFSGFGITLLPAALLTFGSGLGLAMVIPRFRDRPGAASAGEVAAIGCLGVVVAAIALQGFLGGIGGPLVGIGAVMAIALFVITVAAFANRDRRARTASSSSRGRGRR